MQPITGEKLCRYFTQAVSAAASSSISGPLVAPSNCHCTMCRKQHGAAFRSRARVEKSDFKCIQGEELVTFYESTPGCFRGFCRVCGSPVINKFREGTPIAERDPKAPSRYGVALATLDDDPGIRPAAHTFAAYKAPWFEITDDLPQHPEGRVAPA